MRLSAALAALALVSGGCSAIVSPEDLPIRCSEDGACPQGQVCEDEVCVEEDDPDPPDAGDGCKPNDEPELCNGLDDDCDGETDEGHDADGDGVTWCNGGEMEGRDCNDQDPDETPGKTEVCDGRDNDCNGAEDDGVCEGSTVCEPASGECVTRDCRDDGCEAGNVCEMRSGSWSCVPQENPDDCRDGSAPCENGEVCNLQNGECVPGGELDDTCRNDSDCREPLCLDPASLRMADGDSFCSRSCCRTSDCPDDFVCWQPGGGFSACVTRARLGLGAGDGGDGAACASDSDCASGACVESACAEPCCDDDSCSGQSCTVSLTDDADDPAKLVCDDGGLLGAGFPCGANEDCASLFCVDPGYCTAPCCNSPDCGDGMVCAYATLVGPTDPQERLCISATDWGGPIHGDGLAGTACIDEYDCRGFRCEDGFCVDTCCQESDCPAGTSCVFSPVLDGGEFLCVKDP